MEAAWQAVRAELLRQITCMAGTEECNGRLWQLKDLCHRIWPQTGQEHAMHGMLLDWTVGSLFHECLKLKETLYFLENHGARTVVIDNLSPRIEVLGASGDAVIWNVPRLIGQILEGVGLQMERVGFCLVRSAF